MKVYGGNTMQDRKAGDTGTENSDAAPGAAVLRTWVPCEHSWAASRCKAANAELK